MTTKNDLNMDKTLEQKATMAPQSKFQRVLGNFTRLRTKFLVLVLPPIVICMGVYSVLFSFMTYRTMEVDMQSKLDTMINIQRATLSEPIWSYNQNMVERIVETMALDTDVQGVKVIDSFGNVLTEIGVTDSTNQDSRLFRQEPIIHDRAEANSEIGSLIITFSDERIWAAIYSQTVRDILLIALLLTAVMLSALIANMIIIDRPLAVFLRAITTNKEGRERHIMEWHTRDELGQVIHTYNDMLDALWEREDALSDSQLQLKTVTDNLPGAVVQIARDKSGQYEVEFVSQGIQDLLGTRPKVLVDELQRWSMHIATADMTRLITHLDESARSMKPTTVEIRMTTVEGSSIWVHLLCRPRMADKSRIVWDSLLLDVTEKHVLENRLRELATTDGLTGLNNRRHFMDLTRNEIMRCRRHKASMSVAAIDCDHFKKVNDTYGHATGDFVLKEFARLVREQLREIDIVGRLGGEEFAIALVNTDLEGARIVSQRICDRIAEHLIVHGGHQFHFTVSIGLAEIDASEEDISNLLKRADRALYHAKDTGRNRVVADIDIPDQEPEIAEADVQEVLPDQNVSRL